MTKQDAKQTDDESYVMILHSYRADDGYSCPIVYDAMLIGIR